MKTWQIVAELKQIFRNHDCWRLAGITSENFRYISDFEDIAPLDRRQYEEHLKKQLKHFNYQDSLDISEESFNRSSIEIILQKKTHSCRHHSQTQKPDFQPFLEPRLLQCKIKNGKISEMHLCSPLERKIPKNVQEELLSSCKRNDFDAAAAAIGNGAYAATCADDRRPCLSYAAESGSADLCRLLIEDDADFQTVDWETIFYAVTNPDVEVLKYLLRQGAPADVVGRFTEDNLPMTPLDYARYLHNHAAEKVLQEYSAPTLAELKDWCFRTGDFKIRLSDRRLDGGDMFIGAVGDEVDGRHIRHSTSCLWMELEHCWALIIPFFRQYHQGDFEPYLDDNLVTLGDAEKALRGIRDFIEVLENDFDDPQVAEILSHITPAFFIEWGKRSRLVAFSFSEEEDFQLWKAHRSQLTAFYREFCAKMESFIEEAKGCGDRFIDFVGP